MLTIDSLTALLFGYQTIDEISREEGVILTPRLKRELGKLRAITPPSTSMKSCNVGCLLTGRIKWERAEHSRTGVPTSRKSKIQLTNFSFLH